VSKLISVRFVLSSNIWVVCSPNIDCSIRSDISIDDFF